MRLCRLKQPYDICCASQRISCDMFREASNHAMPQARLVPHARYALLNKLYGAADVSSQPTALATSDAAAVHALAGWDPLILRQVFHAP